MSTNPETLMTLDDAVAEVLGVLTGLDLEYDPDLDRYQAITRALNRAMRSCALEKEWSYFSDTEIVGAAVAGENEITLSSSIRPRMVNDDAARLIDERGRAVRWAYFLPRDALHKYVGRRGLWCSITRNTLTFSREFNLTEDGFDIQVPVMREPIMFRLPQPSEDPLVETEPVPDEIRNQEIDFPYPDLIVLRAAYFYAQTDPVMQPRVQTLEAQYKDLMYQVIERDDRMTDSPYLNEWSLNLHNGIHPVGDSSHHHPHADEPRR